MPMFHGKDSKCLHCKCSLEGLPSSTIYCSRECRRAFKRAMKPGNPQNAPTMFPAKPEGQP